MIIRFVYFELFLFFFISSESLANLSVLCAQFTSKFKNGRSCIYESQCSEVYILEEPSWSSEFYVLESLHRAQNCTHCYCIWVDQRQQHGIILVNGLIANHFPYQYIYIYLSLHIIFFEQIKSEGEDFGNEVSRFTKD